MPDDEELEMLRRRRQQQLHAQADRQSFADNQKKEIEDQKKEALRKIMEPEARERLGRLRMGYPDLAENVENQLIMLAVQGRLGKRITDGDLVAILKRVQPKKKEMTITRK